MMVQRVEELEVFKRSYKVSLEIHKLSLNMPAIEQSILADQIRRASKSICANIAEGFGKQSDTQAEFKRFLKMSIGSADEIRIWLRYCVDLGYIEQQAWKHWRDEYEEIAKMLQGLVKSVNRPYRLIPES